ncbi:hypothetical protein M413DRAFT_438648 [Hebeloma cylindrosporum]|uniref:SRR1-like domain-containing protein n=1 Tax=Hebeloma cylindrosporum TaxID=76867 RepID=A0A0C2YI64_HEBCY|nr:hypothetical protein M413DRAFT_438648 [Hebeloma cylindrosporum h7]
MPHCDLELYEAVLQGIWTQEGISNFFLLGNHLQEYIDNRPISTLESKVPCLLRAVPFLESQSLPIPSPWPTAFNNTSVQYWRRQSQSHWPDNIFEELPWRKRGDI